MHIKRALMAVLAIFIMLSVTSCGSKNVKKAKEFITVKMYDQALELLQKEIIENPNNQEAHFLSGNAYLLKGDDENAKQAFERAILIETSYKGEVGKFYIQIANENLENNENRALRLYQEACKYDLSLKEQVAQIFFNKAIEIALVDHKSERPLTYLKYAVDFNEGYRVKATDFAYETSKKYLEKSFSVDALRYAKVSIAIDPKHLQEIGILFYEIGMKFGETADIPNFIMAFNEGKTVSPEYKKDDAAFLWWSGEYCYLTGNYADAKKYYTEVVEKFITTEFGKKAQEKLAKWETLVKQYLSDLSPTSFSVGAGTFTTDRHDLGDQFIIGGKTLEKGLYAHAPSKVEYMLPKGGKYLKAVIGLHKGVQGKVVFKILLDAKETYKSPIITGSKTATIDIPLNNATTLTLIVDPQGDNEFDWSVWGNAYISYQ